MVSKEKIKEFERIKSLIENYKNYIILDLKNTPNSIYKKVQSELKKKGSILTVTKTRIFKKVVEKDLRFSNILEKLPNMISIIFTNEDPLSIYHQISNIRVYRYAKAGDVSPIDIWIRAGPTNFAPGPIISELSKVGLQVGVEKGKVAVKKDLLLVKKGDIIDADKASVLQKFDIRPIEIKLNIKSVLLDSIWIFEDNLYIFNEIENLVKTAYNNALNLSVNINYPTEKNIAILLQKAYLNAKSLSKILG